MSKKLNVKLATDDDFFRRGRAIARLADAGKALPDETVLSFAEPDELLQFLTKARVALLRAVKEQPDSIYALASRLHRDRSAVKRDIDVLARAGVVAVESVVSPGHGRKKLVTPVAHEMRLEAVFA